MEKENILIVKLKRFIKKYYKNKLIKGLLLCLGILVSLFILEIILEYFNYLHTVTRGVLLIFFLVFSITLLVFQIVIPAIKYFRIGRVLSYEEAAKIIGEHFSEVQDKLLNTLNLIKENKENSESALIEASIEQRTDALKIISFSKVINLKKNIRYLNYAIPPLIVLVAGFIFSPEMISGPAGRIIHFSKHYSLPAPVRIVLLNSEMKAMQQDDLLLKIRLEGDELPDGVDIRFGNSTARMTKTNLTEFNYLFKALQSNISFIIIAGEIESEKFEISVYPRPIILNFEVGLTYPSYTEKKAETLENIGDLTIPEGTNIFWKIFTRDVECLEIRFDNKVINKKNENSNVFSFSKTIKESLLYSLRQRNSFSEDRDSLSFKINVIKDAYPEIDVKTIKDSAARNLFFYNIVIRDDYGFSGMKFYLLEKESKDSSYKAILTENLYIDKRSLSQNIFYSLNTDSLTMLPGKKFKCFFEIWDNDEINGPKSVRSKEDEFEVPSLDEIAREREINSESIDEAFREAILKSREIKKEIEDLNKRMIEQNNISYKEKKKIENLIKAGEEIKKHLDEIQKRQKESMDFDEKYLEDNIRILEKQRKLNEMADQLFSEEMKKVIQDIKQLINQLDKNKLNELIPRLDKENKNIEKELDRNLEIMKQLEFQRNLEKKAEEIRQLSKEQEKLAIESGKQKKSEEKEKLDQKKLEIKYDSLSKEMEKLIKEEKEITNENRLKETDETRKKIKQNLGKSLDLMDQNKMDEASGKQKETAENMNELATQLDELFREQEEEELAEDAEALKLLLQNLNALSFEQEDCIYRTGKISRNDPALMNILEIQRNLETKFSVLDDSLNKIANRQIMIKSYVLKESQAVKENMYETLKMLSDHNLGFAMTKAQMAMTSLNNLALLISEAITQINEQKDNQMSASGTKRCKKPKKPGGKSTLPSMSKMQKELNEKLQRMKESIGKEKPGNAKDRRQEESISREIAQMAAEQEAIRKQLQDYENLLKEQGAKNRGDLNDVIQEMEKTEKDILNKQINKETLNRQQRIMNRMLESEKAEEKREKEEKRESTEASNLTKRRAEEDYKERQKVIHGMDVIQLTPLPINYFYKVKAEEYLMKLNSK